MKKVLNILKKPIDLIITKIKDINKTSLIIKLSVFLTFVLVVFVMVIIIKNGAVKFPTKQEYDKTGFIEASKIEDTSKVLENDKYKFEIDLTTTHFKYIDKTSGITYTSYKNTTKQDTLTVFYSGTKGIPKEVSNYEKSINHEGQKCFMIRILNNSIEVLYQIGGKMKIDYTDLPELISATRYEDYLNKANQLYESSTLNSADKSKLKSAMSTVKASYNKNDKVEKPYYKLDNPKNLSSTYVNRIYDYFYTFLGYTKDDLQRDCFENGVDASRIYPKFEMSLKYELENDGLKIALVNDSIKDYEEAPLAYINVLPYFGAADEYQKGYAVVPDGSGIMLDFNSNRSYAKYYESRIYGSDLAKLVTSGGYDVKKVNFGLYGMCFEESSSSNGFINIIEDGAESCSVIAEMNTTSTTGANKLNKVHYRYYYRETDTYEFTAFSGANTIQSWTNDYNTSNLELKVKMLCGDASYTKMAKSYQEDLIKQKILKKQSVKDLNLNLILVGGYIKDTTFLGIPYQKVESLTSCDEVLEISKELKNKNVNNLNIIYDGYFNEGINQRSINSIKYNNVITSRKKLINLTKMLKEMQIDLYPNMRVASAYSSKNIKEKEKIRNLYGKEIKIYPIYESTYSINTNATPLYYIKPTYFDKNIQKVIKELSKLSTTNLSIADLGNVNYGSYKSKDIIFRSQMVDSYQKAMEKLKEKNINIMINNPSAYALKYTDIAYNLDYDGTNYQIVATSIPFYQLVISGCIDYSGISINLSDEHNYNYYKMKSIETLSNIQMTWTYKNTVELIDTEYNYYYSTYYKNWLDKTIDLYKELNDLNIYKSSLSNHILLDQNGLVTLSEYSNGAKIIFNYQPTSFTYDTYVVSPNSYLVINGGI